jgi:hypothetical protein
MNNPLKKSILGYISPWGPDPKENRTPIGLQTLVFGTADQPFAQDIDEKGNVCGFLRLQALAEHEYVALPAPTEPQLGQPHFCAMVTNKEPGSMLVGSWIDMAGYALKSYPDMRAELLRHPVAGFRLAGFVLGQAPRYAAASNRTADLGFDLYEFELNRLRIDDQHYFRLAPEVLQLARESGLDIKWPPSSPTMTP